MIDSFKDEFAFLSNFAQVTVSMYGVLYPSVEHAFQAAKTLDPVQRENIRLAPTAGQAKRMGREVTLRPDWDEFRLVAMETLLRRKFAQQRLAVKLVATHPHELVEGNWWNDRFWGVCQGTGENHLGRLLMKVRNDLLTQQQ